MLRQYLPDGHQEAVPPVLHFERLSHVPPSEKKRKWEISTKNGEA